MKDNKLLLTISIVTLVAILIVGSTFAVWSWSSDRSNDTNVTFTTEKGFSCSVDGGGNITEADIKLVPTSCDNSEYVIKREITTNVVNSSGRPIYMDLWLDIKKFSQGLSDSHNFRYVLTTSSTSCTEGNILTHGTFNRKEVDEKIDLLFSDKYLTSGTKTYYLYIWLDYNGIDRTSQDEEFDLELGGECKDSANDTRVYEANKPYVYNTGLIPVKLSDSGDTVTTVAEDDPTWYSYTETDKKWANAILVSDTNREKYKNYPGTVVNQDDILAYYVWIPRYSYKVWRLSGVTANQTEANAENHSIDIKFIPTNVIDELPTEVDKYYTHPAFWWDDDSDGVRDEGEEISGIWVGKFETHHTASTTSVYNLNCSSSTCDSSKYNKLRILPNLRPLTNNTVSSFFYASRGMEANGNAFGINSNMIDSHMMKNSEWGSVAYLSRSKYGLNGEVRINNTYNIVYAGSTMPYLTGCGSLSENTAASATCDIQYGSTSSGIYPQSTSGNVTGVFDMSGGTLEYVMGVYNKNSNRSGFNDSTNLWPEGKYYDNYTFSHASCTLATCGGHALTETRKWYNDASSFVDTLRPWFYRGGGYNNSSASGIFSYGVDYGNADVRSFRLVLIQN